MGVMEAAFDPYWREAWTRAQVASSLALPHTRSILIDVNGRFDFETPSTAAGFVLARRVPGEEELLLIAVKPECRKQGFGKLLLEEFASSAKHLGAEKVFLEMRDGNPAETLYRSEGFEPIGRRREYYRTTEGTALDALTFVKVLNV
ncbi:GNAT family N-acetyltransferase [Qipengyuania spongiae]|uniref:GNAT family N-acetyltransferase n=1 Tax=Qipengyuania spongiae TaxID=2909673 RepID=A0ABY5SUW9_9SPHN|nr:GNAT family N-acetyltransferase [Qipengyuania spongiae]UVI38125.1 GNAT family N-acetyltransferase [Qipengyuania spongiae]